MISPYSLSSFTLQSPDCSENFFFRVPALVVSTATISSRCHHKDFLLNISFPSYFPAGTQAACHHSKWSKSPVLNFEGISRMVAQFWIWWVTTWHSSHSLNWLLLQLDEYFWVFLVFLSSRCSSFWVDASVIQGCRSYPCCWLVLPFALLPADTACTHVFCSSNFGVLSFSILHTSIRPCSASDHLLFFSLSMYTHSDAELFFLSALRFSGSYLFLCRFCREYLPLVPHLVCCPHSRSLQMFRSPVLSAHPRLHRC